MNSKDKNVRYIKYDNDNKHKIQRGNSVNIWAKFAIKTT